MSRSAPRGSGETPGTPDGSERPISPKRRGRRVAMALYYGLAAVITVSSTYQLMRQVFLTPAPPSPYASCEDGLRALAGAVDRARSAASGTEGEDAALARFRQALDPDWRYRDSVELSCRGSDRNQRALDAIERLRYAEEHAVRREAGDLAPLRRRVQTIVDIDLQGRGPNSPGAAPPPRPDGPPP